MEKSQAVGVDHGPAPTLREHAEAHWCPWSYYERFLFNWFLARFDLQAAREVYRAARFPSWLQPAAVAVVVAVVAGCLQGLDLSRSLVVFLALGAGGALVVGSSGRLFRIPSSALLLSMIPRLAAAVGLGYLFLAGAPQLVRLVYESARDPWQLVAATLLLLATAFGFLVLHIFRRVFPAPAPRPLLRRAADVLLLGVAYAAAELLVAGPLLFSHSLLTSFAIDPLPHPPRWFHLTLCAAVALNLGVLLQLAWDEKPLTEPL